MAFSSAKGLMILVMASSMLATTCMANRGWHWGWGFNQTGSGSGSGSNVPGWPPNHNGSGSNFPGWPFNHTGWGFNFTGWPMNHTGWGFHHPNATGGPKKIIVGGPENWHFGFNYSDWALKNGPFYINDVLVFKYDAPNANTFAHSVYSLPDLRSYLTCDLKKGKKIADVTQGKDDGFPYVLDKWGPHYFACGERNGLHCKVGMMKFFVLPSVRWF